MGEDHPIKPGSTTKSTSKVHAKALQNLIVDYPTPEDPVESGCCCHGRAGPIHGCALAGCHHLAGDMAHHMIKMQAACELAEVGWMVMQQGVRQCQRVHAYHSRRQKADSAFLMKLDLKMLGGVLQMKSQMPKSIILSSRDALPQALSRATSCPQTDRCLGPVRLYLQ